MKGAEESTELKIAPINVFFVLEYTIIYFCFKRHISVRIVFKASKYSPNICRYDARTKFLQQYLILSALIGTHVTNPIGKPKIEPSKNLPKIVLKDYWI